MKLNDLSVLKFAISTRLVLWTYSLIVSYFIRDYDTSSKVWVLTFVVHFDLFFFFFDEKITIGEPVNTTDAIIYAMFGHFVKWDSIYYFRIAEVGYEFEQTFAFFPFFPVLLGIVARSLQLIFQLSFGSAIILGGFLIANITFVLAAVVFERFVSSKFEIPSILI